MMRSNSIITTLADDLEQVHGPRPIVGWRALLYSGIIINLPKCEGEDDA